MATTKIAYDGDGEGLDRCIMGQERDCHPGQGGKILFLISAFVRANPDFGGENMLVLIMGAKNSSTGGL